MNIPLRERAAAWKLSGLETETGWKVIETVGWDASTGEAIDIYNGTGGNFSVAYRVQKDGHTAFMKAIDFTAALQSDNVVGKLDEITSAHRFETKILEICGGERLNKVVVALESGQISTGANIQDVAPYLIFELADGDVRKQIRKVDEQVRLAWWLRAMHHSAVGLSQLHSKKISHQDFKPSNVLEFGSSDDFKIADLGRSVCDTTAGPYDEMVFPGDFKYAPPEIVYGHIDPDASQRRLSCDTYQLGSMIFFYVLGLGSTELLIGRLERSHWPLAFGGGWTDSFSRVLPDLQNSFTEILDNLAERIDTQLSVELVKAASELCNPDPSVRGHPLNRGVQSNQFSLTRYVSIFNRLAKQAEILARVNSN